MSTNSASARFKDWIHFSRKEFLGVSSILLIIGNFAAVLVWLKFFPTYRNTFTHSQLLRNLAYLLVGVLGQTALILGGYCFVRLLIPLKRRAELGITLTTIFSLILFMMNALYSRSVIFEFLFNYMPSVTMTFIVVLVILITRLVSRSNQVTSKLLDLVNRLHVLAALYFLFDVFSLGFVILRNLWSAQ